MAYKPKGPSLIPKTQLWWNTLVIPTLRRQRRVDPWESQPSLLGEFQVSERPSLNKKVAAPEQHVRLAFDLHMPHTRTPAHW